MSYDLSLAFHTALKAFLKTQTTFYDDEGRGADDCVIYASERSQDWSTQTDDGLEVQFILSVLSRTRGMSALKELAGQVCDALLTHTWTLTTGRVVLVEFERVDLKEKGGTRRLDLRFRTLLEDNT